MKELYLKYAYHIDSLREEAGIKVPDFCEEVCEPRTYRYYISGQRVMSQKALNGFCKKLGFTPAEFYSSYNQFDKEEYQIVARLYYAIRKSNFLKARKIFILLENRNFTNVLAESIYEYCIIEYNYRNEVITKDSAYDRYRTLINYPKCLDKKSFTIQETLTIQSIATIEYSIKEYTALNFLERYLTDPSYSFVSSDPKDILPNIYATVAFYFGMDENYQKCQIISKRGIEICEGYNTLYELDKLYYYYLYSCFKLNNDEYKKYIPKYLAAIIIKHDKEYLKSKLEMLRRDGIDNPEQYFSV